MMQFVQTTHSLMQFVMSEQMNPYLYFVHLMRIELHLQMMRRKHASMKFVNSIHIENHLLMMPIMLLMMLNQIPEYFLLFLH